MFISAILPQTINIIIIKLSFITCLNKTNLAQNRVTGISNGQRSMFTSNLTQIRKYVYIGSTLLSRKKYVYIRSTSLSRKIREDSHCRYLRLW